MKRLMIPISILTVFAGVACTAEKTITINKTAEGYQFLERGKPVLFYRVKPKQTAKGTHTRSNYCHPIAGLDGNPITEDFPADHLHHRGVFWAWHQVYVGKARIKDMWDCKDFIWDIQDVKIIADNADSAALQATVFWKSPQWEKGEKAFAKESVTIRLYATTDHTRIIDFEIDIIALAKDLRIGGSDNAKGYGGFSTRLVLPRDIKMTDSRGEVKPTRLAVAAGDWVNLGGTLTKGTSGFAIFVHPKNPGGTRKWILRKARSSQNVAYPGRKPVGISMEKPLSLKYRLVIHNKADLKKLFEKFANQD